MGHVPEIKIDWLIDIAVSLRLYRLKDIILA